MEKFSQPFHHHSAAAAGGQIKHKTPRAKAFAIIAICFIVSSTFFRWRYLPPPPPTSNVLADPIVTKFEVEALSKGLVPLEAHLTSKSADTRDALRELILPVMQQVSDKVDFQLSYIGKATEDDGVECKYGPGDCMGNIIELCTRELYLDPKISLGFIMCLARDYRHIPERSLVEDCALEHAIDMKALNDCATKDDGAHGMDLLRNSVARSAELGITTSCTIRLNGQVYCIRNDGEWSDCPAGPGVNDLVVAVEKLYFKSQEVPQVSS